jgi:hypothetical protein
VIPFSVVVLDVLRHSDAAATPIHVAAVLVGFVEQDRGCTRRNDNSSWGDDERWWQCTLTRPSNLSPK